jgi:L-seryl-tRNA(Ser) seleniumtransferase
MPTVTNPFRKLPSVSQLMESPPLKSLVETASHNVVVNGVRSFLDRMREQVVQTTTSTGFHIPSAGELASRIADWIRVDQVSKLKPVINGTGILLHTGLGRAPLAEEAIESIAAIAAGYASVEFDLESGERGHRSEAVRKLLCELTGAASATVVNNNAAATLLALAAIGSGGEVICSRGQLIEIGGSYRLPEVMEYGGAKLREVGTTNKTRLSDYEQAIGPNTKAILKVHPSNFRIVGFTESVDLPALVRLGQQHRLPVIDDVGSGALVDFAKYGLADEPIVGRSIQAGADLVLFSGDKLVGGPQCGILVGRKDLIQRIEKHPLMRAVRVDKLTLAALAATLRLFRNLELAEQKIPLLVMLSTPLDNLKFRAEKLAAQLRGNPALESVDVLSGTCLLGGGSVPTQEIPSFQIGIKPREHTVDQLAAKLRQAEPALAGRIQDGRFLIDVRTIPPRYDAQVVRCFAGAEEAATAAQPADVAASPSEIDSA